MDSGELLTGIIRTLGLTALVVLGYSWVIRKFSGGLNKGVAVGVLFALGGIISMNDPIRFAPGVIYDGRTALLALAYPYGGPIGTLIALAAMTAYRIWIGGIGSLSGVIGMGATALIGFACTLIPVRKLKIGPARSLLIGIAASTSLAAITLLPHEIMMTLVGIPLITVIIANIAGVTLLGEFLEREKSRQRIMRALEHEASVDPLTKLRNASSPPTHELRQPLIHGVPYARRGSSQGRLQGCPEADQRHRPRPDGIIFAPVFPVVSVIPPSGDARFFAASASQFLEGWKLHDREFRKRYRHQ